MADALIDGAITVTSKTMPADKIGQILSTPGIFFKDGHFEYPVSNDEQIGNHLRSVFLIEPIASNAQFVDWIVEDVARWMDAQKIKVDAVFAPAQPAVKTVVDKLAQKKNVQAVYLEYLPGGWFGSKVVSGELKPGAKVLVFNGVSQQGRCVSNRLPFFVENLGGQPIAAAVFAKGTADGVKAAEQKFGDMFYSTIQVNIPISAPADCSICKHDPSSKPTPWTQLKP
ncbi:MAG: hypothetical protein K2Y22_09790 [Candidatus Obscuribacterales bacterium]|nr:hypothetical protein [Candidatus Obscuribacterales bacterium]